MFQSIILGIIQGLTEFLPVSSSGHLVLAPYFFSWTDPGLAYDVSLHMGTLVAVLIFFWRDWVGLAKSAFSRTPAIKGELDFSMLIIGCIPAAVSGLLLNDYAEHTFRHPIIVAVTLALFGGFLWYWDRRGTKERGFEALTLRDSLIIGCAQALAIVPGVSRSGVTITAALALGLTRPAATRFSFLLSAPIIAGAGVLKSKYILEALAMGGEQAAAIVTGFMASLVSGLFAIWLLSYMIKGRTFAGFAIYRLILSLVIIALFFSR